jgi:hypothetical protein
MPDIKALQWADKESPRYSAVSFEAYGNRYVGVVSGEVRGRGAITYLVNVPAVGQFPVPAGECEPWDGDIPAKGEA